MDKATTEGCPCQDSPRDEHRLQINIHVDWTAFYKDTAPSFHRYFFSKLLDPNDADDCLQETLKRFLKGIDNYDSGRDLIRYLWGIASNVLADFLRKERYQKNPEVALEDCKHLEDGMNVESEVIARDTVWTLARRAHLSEFQTIIYYLNVVEGYKPRDIAFVMEVPSEKIRRELYRARQKLGTLGTDAIRQITK